MNTAHGRLVSRPAVPRKWPGSHPSNPTRSAEPATHLPSPKHWTISMRCARLISFTMHLPSDIFRGLLSVSTRPARHCDGGPMQFTRLNP
ncbi:hypothetical protein [Paraburkholderia sp. BL6665CI2N2]|uniref:hypothetical protein n=1 Tax=Paraburkholderia sp. BL6665CI2N2 TaxID=1938806 RepID=UPI001416FA1D|nr:hypothetical protein [Paraburkholderia sp. BL6665CI2N2]